MARPEEHLATAMGVTRSAAPKNMLKKLLHAGNEKVQLVGVGVENVSEFDGMDNARLLGAAPNGSAADSVAQF